MHFPVMALRGLCCLYLSEIYRRVFLEMVSKNHLIECVWLSHSSVCDNMCQISFEGILVSGQLSSTGILSRHACHPAFLLASEHRPSLHESVPGRVLRWGGSGSPACPCSPPTGARPARPTSAPPPPVPGGSRCPGRIQPHSTDPRVLVCF